VSGTIVSNGRSVTIRLDAGQDRGEGVLVINGGKTDIRVLPGVVYLRADRRALEADGLSAAQAKTAAGKWETQKFSAGKPPSVAKFVLVPTFFKQVLKPSGKVARGHTATVNGRSEYYLIDHGKRSPDGRLYVPTTGDPLPLRIVSNGRRGSVTLSRYGEALHVTAPASAQASA
jgi:hypothetical protein